MLVSASRRNELSCAGVGRKSSALSKPYVFESPRRRDAPFDFAPGTRIASTRDARATRNSHSLSDRASPSSATSSPCPNIPRLDAEWQRDWTRRLRTSSAMRTGTRRMWPLLRFRFPPTIRAAFSEADRSRVRGTARFVRATAASARLCGPAEQAGAIFREDGKEIDTCKHYSLLWIVPDKWFFWSSQALDCSRARAFLPERKTGVTSDAQRQRSCRNSENVHAIPRTIILEE